MYEVAELIGQPYLGTYVKYSILEAIKEIRCVCAATFTQSSIMLREVITLATNLVHISNWCSVLYAWLRQEYTLGYMYRL